MRLRPFRLVPVLAAVMLLLVPALAVAQGEPTDQDIAINTIPSSNSRLIGTHKNSMDSASVDGVI